MSSDFEVEQLRCQSWSQLPRFTSEGQKSPKRLKDSPVSTLAFDEQKIYGFCPHQDIMCVAQCSTCHSHFKLRSLRTHMNNRHNAKLKSPEGLPHGFTDVLSPQAAFSPSEVFRTKAEISSDSGVSTSSSTSSRRNASPPSLSLPSPKDDDGLIIQLDKMTADKPVVSNRRPKITAAESLPIANTTAESKGKFEVSQPDSKLQPRVKLKNAVEAAARNRAKLTTNYSSDSRLPLGTPKSSTEVVRSSKSVVAQPEPEKIPFFPPEIPTRSHYHPSTVVGMLKTTSMPIPLGRKLPVTSDRPPLLTRSAKSDMTSIATRKMSAGGGNSFVNILSSSPRMGAGGNLSLQITSSADAPCKPSTSDVVESQKGNITIRIKKAILQQHMAKPKILSDDKRPLNCSRVHNGEVSVSGDFRPSGSFPNLSSTMSGLLTDDQTGSAADAGAQLDVVRTIVVGEMPKKRVKKDKLTESRQCVATTSRPVVNVSSSATVPKPTKTFDDLLMEEIQLQSSSDCQPLVDQDSFLTRMDDFLLDDFKPPQQTLEQLKNGLIHDPLLPSVSGTTDIVDALMVPAVVRDFSPTTCPDYSQLKWNDSNNNPPAPVAISTFGARRYGAAVYVFNRGYDSVRNCVQMVMREDADSTKADLKVEQFDCLRPSSSRESACRLNRPYKPVQIGQLRKGNEMPRPTTNGTVLHQKCSPVVRFTDVSSPWAVVGSNCTVGDRPKKEQQKSTGTTGVVQIRNQPTISAAARRQKLVSDGFTAPRLTQQQRVGQQIAPRAIQKSIQSARNSPTSNAGSSVSFAVQLVDRCASAPVICDIDGSNSPSGSEFSPCQSRPPMLFPSVSVGGGEIPAVSRVVSVASSTGRSRPQLASVDSTLSAMLAGALHKGKANVTGTNLKRQRTLATPNLSSAYGSSSQSSQLGGNGIHCNLKRQKLVDGLQHYVTAADPNLYGSSNHNSAKQF